MLDNHGKKPWEINNIDTLDLWKFGDYKHTSLDLLTHIFNIPAQKHGRKPSSKSFYEEDNLDKIINYCEKDVVATIQLFRGTENR